MNFRSWRPRISTFAVLTLAAGLSLAASAAPAAAASYGAIGGQFSIFTIASANAPVQLLAGSNGDVWFVTAASRLGHITASGQITLLAATLPHGSAPASLVAADADGVWAFGNPTGGCTTSLVRPGGHVVQRTLNFPVTPVCKGGAVDRSGNLWVSVQGGSFPSGVSRMVEVSPSGVVTHFMTDRLGARPTAVALGGDGAIWALEFNEHAFGRYTQTPPATGFSIRGPVKPPYQGTPFWGLVPHQLFARSDGTFWLVQGGCCNAIALSSPGQWAVRYLLPFQISVGGMSPDGSMWTVNFDRSGTGSRLMRTAVNGALDRSSVLPAAAGAEGFGGPLAAATDGSIWIVTSKPSGATFVVRFVPS